MLAVGVLAPTPGIKGAGLGETGDLPPAESAFVPDEETAPATDPAPDAPPSASAPRSFSRLTDPLPVRVMHPFYLPFYQPVGDRAGTIGRGEFTTSIFAQYSNYQRQEIIGADESDYDGEFLRLSFTLRYGILDDLELLVELPFHSSSSGFLDPVIKGFHNSTGLTNDGRQNNRFAERLVLDGNEVLNESPRGFDVADIPIQLKYRILDDTEDAFGLAIRGALELPTGSESRWVGNGEVDGGIGLLFEKAWRDWVLTLNADYRFLSNPGRLERAGLDLKPVPSFVAALGWQPWERLGFVAQLDIAEELFDGRRIEVLDNPQVQFSAAARFRVGDRLRWVLGLSEDIVHSSSPDVTFFLGFEMGFAEDS